MLTPEACIAMICIASASHVRATLLAFEIFDDTRKALRTSHD